MPSSPPTLPDLSSGSSSPSISSVDTASSAGGRSALFQGPGDHGTASVISAVPGSAAAGEELSSATSSSWSTAAPSASSMARSLAISVPDSGVESGMYVCLFHILDCYDSFDDAVLWRTHVFSHFRTHPPPPTARCPLCPDTKFVDGGIEARTSEIKSESEPSQEEKSNGADAPPEPARHSAWNRMLDHVATDHYQHGQTLAGSRADFELMRYLYGLRIITDAQFKAMQLAPAPSSPAYHRSQDGVRASIGSSDEPYCAPYSRRREDRRRSQQRGVSVV